MESAKQEVAHQAVAGVQSAVNSAGSSRAATISSDNLSEANIRVVEKIVERIVERPLRRRLPDTRNAITHKFDVQGHEGYITCGLYKDGQPGEVFVTMAKEGSTIGGLMDTIATLVSLSLQYGVPIESLVRKFEHTRFEPSGMTRNPEIPMAKSLVDYIFRWLAMEFIPGYRAAHAPRRPQPKSSSPSPDHQTDKEGEQPDSAKSDTTASLRSSNGHGPRLDEPDAKPFDYGSGLEEQVQQASSTKPSRQATTPASSDNLRLVGVVDPLSQQGADMQSDAPACDVCGSITVRSGTCYKCLNCGNSMGCS